MHRARLPPQKQKKNRQTSLNARRCNFLPFFILPSVPENVQFRNYRGAAATEPRGNLHLLSGALILHFSLFVAGTLAASERFQTFIAPVILSDNWVGWRIEINLESNTFPVRFEDRGTFFDSVPFDSELSRSIGFWFANRATTRAAGKGRVN